MKKSKSIILLSGGMDSVLILAKVVNRGDEVFTIFFKYGQKTEAKELECFHQINDFYKIEKTKRKVIDLSALRDIGGSSLTDDSINVTVELDSGEVPNSYVPFRNSIFLSCTVSWAEVIKADKIIIGAVLEDSPGYPDCRPEYYWAFQELIKKGSDTPHLIVETPIIRMTKKEIIQNCLELKAPLDLSWSCYQSSKTACLKCDSCLLRKKAFDEIGEVDPIS